MSFAYICLRRRVIQVDLWVIQAGDHPGPRSNKPTSMELNLCDIEACAFHPKFLQELVCCYKGRLASRGAQA